MRFHPIRYNSEPVISITPKGNIYLKIGFVEKYKLRNFTHARIDHSKQCDSISIFLQKKKQFKNCYKMEKYVPSHWAIYCYKTFKPFLAKRNVFLDRSIIICPEWDSVKRRIIVEIK